MVQDMGARLMGDDEAKCTILMDAQEYLRDEHHWLRNGSYTTGQTPGGADVATFDLAEGEVEYVFPPDGSVCAIGALYRAARLNRNIERYRVRNLVGEVVTLFQKAIGEWEPPQPKSPHTIPVWNDHVADHDWLMRAFDNTKKEVCSGND